MFSFLSKTSKLYLKLIYQCKVICKGRQKFSLTHKSEYETDPYCITPEILALHNRTAWLKGIERNCISVSQTTSAGKKKQQNKKTFGLKLTVSWVFKTENSSFRNIIIKSHLIH